MKKLIALVSWTILLGIPLFVARHAQSPRVLMMQAQDDLAMGALSATLVTGLLLYACILLWVIVVFQVLRYVLATAQGIIHGAIDAPRPRFMLAIAGVLALASVHHESDAHTNLSPVAIPAEAVISPALAALVLKDLARRRRTQCLKLPVDTVPVVLDEKAQSVLDGLLQTAAENKDDYSVPSTNAQEHALLKSAIDHDYSLQILYAEVDRVEPLDLCNEPAQVESHTSIVVRLFGYPLVENHLGVRAEFRKTRALELATWLVLNRQRSRRSAARTAMWEQSVSDSTFSTIVSDVRRALGELSPGTHPHDWLRPTFSDELPLSISVTSDAEILQRRLATFRSRQQENLDHVLICLDGVRDLPFAATNYRWPDLDGTTTRLVILVLTACTEVAQFCIETNQAEGAQRAVAAGLRMMPGHDALLETQQLIGRRV
ncbi:MAG: hypothetical protein EXQ63_08900, partial [Ilumatobacteraceae bacterium]|nr:hypothetical protein [Ilumatobacteraceae bacterium]